MDERRAGRILGIFLAEVVYYSVLVGVGICSFRLLSKLLKIAIAREAMKSANKNNDYPDNDLE